MKKLRETEIKRRAEEIAFCWICHYGGITANKLSLAVRREFKEKNNNAKKNNA